jgi:Tfp pilus assembly protein PilN
MEAPNLHLNLLRSVEKKSSSPIRLRVMLPIFALLLCVGCAIWWATLFMQSLLLSSKLSSIRAELDGKKSAHSAVLAEMAEVRDLQAELDQLLAYRNGRHVYGPLLAQLAEVMPTNVQLSSISIPMQPPQMLSNPKNPRIPPLLGPTNTTETMTFRMKGRTEKSAPVTDLMEVLSGENFKDWFVIEKKGGPAQQSPRVHSFRQETRTLRENEQRLLAFDVEFRFKERRFEK